MGQTIPRQHPAVVLRSHFVALRALLAVALVALVALAATVVILATDDAGPARTGKAPSVVVTKVGAPGSVSNETATRRAAVHGKATPAGAGRRYDGGPDEGTRGLGR